jgi:hypothetical protein
VPEGQSFEENGHEVLARVENIPSAQFWHVLAATAPVYSENLPAAHSEHSGWLLSL